MVVCWMSLNLLSNSGHNGIFHPISIQADDAFGLSRLSLEIKGESSTK